MSAISLLRRLLQFDLRTMLLLVAFCAVLSAWYRDRQRLEHLLDAVRTNRTTAANANSSSPTAMQLYLSSQPTKKGKPVSTTEEFIAAVRDVEHPSEFNQRTEQFTLNGGAVDTTPALIQLLSDPSEEIRHRAIDAMSRMPKQPDIAVPVLIDLGVTRKSRVSRLTSKELGVMLSRE